jgi:tryptophanyl-tRNA synthetase
MLSGLNKTSEVIKMSKSVVSSAIYMEDSEKEVEDKIHSSFCWYPFEERKKATIRNAEELKKDPKYVAPKEDFISNNTIMEYAKNIIFETNGHFKFLRPQKHGGPR